MTHFSLWFLTGRVYRCHAFVFVLALTGLLSAQAANPNDPGVIEPVLSAMYGTPVRIPNTDQAQAGQLLNLAGPVTRRDARGAASILGHTITDTDSPHVAMRDALKALADAAKNNQTAAMRAAAQELEDILHGNTQGRIFDGFAMLNYNRGAFVAGHVAGEYKMKVLRDSGQTAISIDGQQRRIWEVDVNFLWYDDQFDSDTFLLRVPVTAHPFDLLRVHFHIYSLVREDFAPTVVLSDFRHSDSVQLPFKGFDSVWRAVHGDSVTDVSVDMPPLRLLRGIYTWGWRVHPPRIQFLQPVFEITNFHTGQVELEPQGMSFAERNRRLSVADIGDAAPEKKMHQVALAALGGASAARVRAMLTDPNTAPRGDWQGWADLAQDQNQLPDEAWDVLQREGIPRGSFGPYRFVSAYANNEMYGEGPQGNKIQGWNQGDRVAVKLINLDKHTHYFRNVDFGPALHDDIATGGFSSGSHSFEIMNFKPAYGAPKVVETQWRAGWGFRPHHGVIQQQDVFPRMSDQVMLRPYRDGTGAVRFGFQYSAAARGGDFLFNPPDFIIGTPAQPSARLLTEADGRSGLAIGQLTEGFGVAKMCDHIQHPYPGFCQDDLFRYNPYGAKNVDLDGDGIPDVLRFPPFLRNPNATVGGDIIPPTTAWKPFLWLNPKNGTIWIDPNDPSKGAWADLTYAHGRPIAAGTDLTANIEAARASAQVFYQFDDLFHDNAIFSPHPTSAPRLPPANRPVFDLGLGVVGGNGQVPSFAATGSFSGGGGAQFTLGQAPALAAAVLVASTNASPLPLLGGTLLPQLPALTAPFVTDSNGQLSFFAAGPGAAGVAYAQFVVLDSGTASGLGFSNALRLLFQP